VAGDIERSAEQRRAARAHWPITRHRLTDEPSDDLSAVTTPAERIASSVCARRRTCTSV